MEKELVKKKKTIEKFDNYIIYTSDNDDLDINNKDFINVTKRFEWSWDPLIQLQPYQNPQQDNFHEVHLCF